MVNPAPGLNVFILKNYISKIVQKVPPCNDGRKKL
jgi:hypothetical protein